MSMAGIIQIGFIQNLAMCLRMNLKQEITIKLKRNLTRLSVVKNLNYCLGYANFVSAMSYEIVSKLYALSRKFIYT